MKTKVAVVIPCYRVRRHILKVISEIAEDDVWRIYVVDDFCPDGSGDFVEQNCNDPRVRILRNESNQGVGGAVMAGYKQAVADGAEVIVKIDGDGQMDAALIPAFVAPIIRGEADYTKGNRFFEIETVRKMPKVRLIGNIGLSFLTKLSSGYWNLFDPTNGYTAISSVVAKHLPFDKISRRYFFESDMLFRLNTLRAVAMDIPMFAEYGAELSNLSVRRELPRFFFKNMRNVCKRIVYNYFIRNFTYATLELVFGFIFFIFGFIYGGLSWIEHSQLALFASPGTVMLAALPTILGIQLILGFVNYDMASVPTIPLQGRLHADARVRAYDTGRS